MGGLKESVNGMGANSLSELMMETHDQAPVGADNGESWLLREPVCFWIRLILGGVFALASLDKIIFPLAFAKSISNYQILPEQFVNLVAVTLPWVELILGALLIFGIWLPGAIAQRQCARAARSRHWCFQGNWSRPRCRFAGPKRSRS